MALHRDPDCLVQGPKPCFPRKSIREGASSLFGRGPEVLGRVLGKGSEKGSEKGVFYGFYSKKGF